MEGGENAVGGGDNDGDAVGGGENAVGGDAVGGGGNDGGEEKSFFFFLTLNIQFIQKREHRVLLRERQR